MKYLKLIFICYFCFFINIYAKNPSILINELVDEASQILSSSDPVESKIIRLNDIAERSVDIDGIALYTRQTSKIYN